MKDHDWDIDLEERDADWRTVQADLPMMNNIRIEKDEEWQGESMSVEQGFLGMFTVSSKEIFLIYAHSC